MGGRSGFERKPVSSWRRSPQKTHRSQRSRGQKGDRAENAILRWGHMTGLLKPEPGTSGETSKILLYFSTEMSKSSCFSDWRKDAQGQLPVPNSEGAYIYVEISWKDFYHSSEHAATLRRPSRYVARYSLQR